MAARTDSIGSQHFHPGAREHLFLAFVSFSRDGLVDIHKTTTETTFCHEQPLPAGRQLERMLADFVDTGVAPRRLYDGTRLEWKTVTVAKEIAAFIDNCTFSAPSEQLRLPFDIHLSFKEAFDAICKSPGTLAELASRHNRNVSDLLAKFSTTNARHAEIFRSRPWLDQMWLEHLPLDCDTAESVTHAVLAEASSFRSSSMLPVSTAAIRWCDSFFATHAGETPKPDFLGLLTAMPRSWWPSTIEDYLVLQQSAKNILGLAHDDVDTAIDLIRPAKGKFAEYFRSVHTSLAPGSSEIDIPFPLVVLSVSRKISDVMDFLAAVDRALVRPFVDADRNIDANNLDTARRIVSENGGLRRYLEASQAWHSTPRMAGKLTTPEHVWPSCVDRFEHQGVEVVELCTAIDLWKEGATMSHCVGGDSFVLSCMKGQSRILTIREGGTTLSTAEFTASGIERHEIRQHRGHGNATPPDRAIVALREWLEAIADGQLAVREMTPVAMPVTKPVELPGTGPTSWRPFIRRDLSKLTWDEFGVEVRRMSLHR